MEIIIGILGMWGLIIGMFLGAQLFSLVAEPEIDMISGLLFLLFVSAGGFLGLFLVPYLFNLGG